MIKIRSTLLMLLTIIILSLNFQAGMNAESSGGDTIVWDTDQILTTNYTVEKETTLIINPGITIYIDRGIGITVKGTLKVIGTANNKISFCSIGQYAWSGITIMSDKQNKNATIISYCQIRNASRGICCYSSSPIITNTTISTAYQGIYCANSSPVFVNVTVTNSDYGIACDNSNPVIVNATISGNKIGISSYNHSSLAISYSIIDSNNNGIFCHDPGYLNITYSKIYNNSKWGIVAMGTELTIENNTFGDDNNLNGEGNIIQQWYLTVLVVDRNNKPIKNVFVTIKDIFGKEFNASTLSYNNGMYFITLTQYKILNNSTKVIYTPHIIYVEKNGVSNSTIIVMDGNKEVTVMLNLMLEENNNYLKPIYIVPIIGTLAVIGACVILIKRKQHKK